MYVVWAPPHHPEQRPDNFKSAGNAALRRNPTETGQSWRAQGVSCTARMMITELRDTVFGDNNDHRRPSVFIEHGFSRLLECLEAAPYSNVQGTK